MPLTNIIKNSTSNTSNQKISQSGHSDRVKILSIWIDNVSLKDALITIDNFLTDYNSITSITKNTPHQIITANSLMTLEVCKNEELKNVFDSAALVIPESAGIYFSAKFLKTPIKEKIPGINFMISILEYAQKKNHSVFFLGSKEEIIGKATDEIKKKFPELKIAGFHNGYFEKNDDTVISKIKSSNAEILFAGLNTPFQEIWLNKNLKKLGVKIAMGVGGSFDVISGNLRRAPKWMIYSNIEWLFRVYQQPYRIIRIIKLFFFALKILKERICF
ncbi:MAG: WecB/TagA/CpsF family glycosyltransferase [Elusimicrobiota bacterium]